MNHNDPFDDGCHHYPGEIAECGAVFIGYQSELEVLASQLRAILAHPYRIKVENRYGVIFFIDITARFDGYEHRFILESFVREGGLVSLWDSPRLELFAPWEFSLARYKDAPNDRAATEYVRRKLKKLALKGF